MPLISSSGALFQQHEGNGFNSDRLILHEMAHSCSIDADNCHFGGIDNISMGTYLFPNKNYVETWGQYHSVLNYLYTNNPKTFDLSDGQNGPPYDQNDWGYMFVGYFQYNANLIEEPYYERRNRRNVSEK